MLHHATPSVQFPGDQHLAFIWLDSVPPKLPRQLVLPRLQVDPDSLCTSAPSAVQQLPKQQSRPSDWFDSVDVQTASAELAEQPAQCCELADQLIERSFPRLLGHTGEDSVAALVQAVMSRCSLVELSDDAQFRLAVQVLGKHCHPHEDLVVGEAKLARLERKGHFQPSKRSKTLR
eukprot:TRINITY_DN24202_c0_g1_i2.p1 TRINITY_DN24202_c0_g1~~TRINITY_DN24202_c0_g1_i2.p1  ORF type:complete len:176 (-),score=18.20 TRINITY_DN24202_c0_g1_i2:302-829(-)